MLEKSNRHLRLKNVHGKNVCVVREVYRREDIPCLSKLCLGQCNEQCPEGSSLLPENVTHYVIPDPQTAREYLEIFENPHIQGIIFTQTAVQSIQHGGSRRLYNRLKAVVKDRRKGSVIFHNEFQTYAHCEREPGEKQAQWHVRATYKAAEWYFNHLAASIPVVMVTDEDQFVYDFGHKTRNLFVVKLRDYLDGFWSEIIPGITDLFTSLQEVSVHKTKDTDYVGYLPLEILSKGIKCGKYQQGFLQVNKSNASQEAFIRRTKVDLTEDSGSDILIPGMAARNRAIHGDLVVVEILPKSQWQSRSNTISNPASEEKGDGDKAVSDRADTMPTGKIVGILQRNWREYVACFSQDEETGRGDKKAGKLLVIPWDYRIPKIRISTRQVDALRDHRIIVRIDSWEPDSTYPNGHFVRSLGKIGDLEAEVAAILVENDLRVPPFSEAQLNELPQDTTQNPWKMSEEEVSSRRDLRDSHLIFSIDPKGCEDVDDTLSVKRLDNGNLELGVHIADVTHFVAPNSLTDIEAQSRSTTVYLADRRYDMLPGVLSANLCSLVSGVDRYAVSVIWELSPSYEVVDVWYGRTVIRSQYKLFYELAQAMHEGIIDAEIVRNIPELHDLWGEELEIRLQGLREAIDELMAVARGLKARRVKSGALELESVEVQVQLSETKSIENLNPKQHLEIHDTIAECMIFANHWVAKKIAEMFPNQALLRHHPLPKDEQFGNLRSCASSRGFNIETSSNKQLAESLDRCVDANDPVVNKLLRSLATQAMSNAAYFCTGCLPRDQFFHYGLALDAYTHFTSPIRRYADVIVHRQLLEAVKKDRTISLPTCTQLEDLSQHINKKHRSSQYAQRESQELFQCLYFRGRGTEDENCIVDAVIFQLRTNGLFVFVPRYGIKGPVYLKSKDGQVLYVTATDEAEWTSGDVTKHDTYCVVDSTLGQQKYCLLQHITVKLSLQDSWAHASSLRLELLSNKPHKKPLTDMEDVAKQQKASIIQEVSSEAVEKRLQLESYDLGENFLQLKHKYGQSEDSMYHLFTSFKQTALNCDT
ncbi:DIS3-like exonuclease 1 [Mercenaria mercenaria]|uniref:DIS3-like exonuclease 1 n=1 Tax=Mercenaria mercenaria TaxID=6596 RepID=UPI00234E6AEF|nr:DIS3-like exonuclease 1 [Mercenaria mercenaria]